MPISDDELIAYLLGDATPQQRKRVEVGLAEDDNLRARLTELRIVLGQLDALQVNFEPPADLLETTMARVDQASREAETVPTQSTLASNLSPTTDTRVRRGTWDTAALALCMAMLLSLFLPTVLRARHESRKAQCAHKMNYLGRGLLDFASCDPQHRIPSVALSGPRSFTGVFAVHLRDLGYVSSPSELWCPSLEGCGLMRGQLLELPSIVELESFDIRKQELCRNEAGGDYSYPMGVAEEGAIVSPRCEGRSHFPILSDSPMLLSANEAAMPHDGLGINQFFEDGHISFVRMDSFDNQVRDNPFCNLRHEQEAGLNPNDASLGPSRFKPLGND